MIYHVTACCNVFYCRTTKVRHTACNSTYAVVPPPFPFPLGLLTQDPAGSPPRTT